MIRWSETAGRVAVRERASGRCEGCGTPGPLEFAHRVRRSQGGLWSPTNALHLCGACHGTATREPALARASGWEVSPTLDPAEVPAWLIHEGIPGWWLLLLASDGTGAHAHLLEAVDPADYGLPDVPSIVKAARKSCA